MDIYTLYVEIANRRVFVCVCERAEGESFEYMVAYVQRAL